MYFMILLPSFLFIFNTVPYLLSVLSNAAALVEEYGVPLVLSKYEDGIVIAQDLLFLVGSGCL